MDPARLYRPAEVAELLGCSEWWVKEQARKRRIPYSRIGGSYRFTAEHVTEIVRLHEVQPAHTAPTGKPARRTPQLHVADAGQPTTGLRARPPRRTTRNAA